MRINCTARNCLSPPKLSAFCKNNFRAARKIRFCRRKSSRARSRSISDAIARLAKPVNDGAISAFSGVWHRIECERFNVLPIQHQLRLQHRIDALNIRPTDLQVIAIRLHLDAHTRFRWPYFDLAVRADLLKNRQRHPENIDVLRQQQALLIHIVRHAPQTAPDHLLAQQLAGKRTQSHDTRDIRRIPTFRQHRHRNDILQLLPRLSAFADGIDQRAQLFLLLQTQQILRFIGRQAGCFDDRRQPRLIVGILGHRFAAFGFFQHAIHPQRFLRCLRAFDQAIAAIEKFLDARCRLGAVAHRQQHRRNGMTAIRPCLRRLAPIVSQNRIRFLHQIRQRIGHIRPAVQILTDFGLAVQVIQLAAITLGVRQRIVAHHDARRFY